MRHTPLNDDLQRLGGEAALPAAPLPEAAGLVAFARRAGLGLFETLALLLKRDWEAAEAAGPATAWGACWQPWQDRARYAELLAAFDAGREPQRLALLLIEQCALGCQHLAAGEVARLAARHARTTALLDAAPPAAQQAFVEDKSDWLLHEFELTGLLALHQQLADEVEGARFRFLAIAGAAYELLVRAGQRLALWRCRRQFGDPTMTWPEVAALLALNRDADNAGAVPLEPELHAVLADDLDEVAGDRRVVHELSLLMACGGVEPASEADLRRATELFRQLARIHPDTFDRHPEAASISPENRARLEQIWNEAMPTHRARGRLSRRRLLDYVRHLESWLREVDAIMRHLSFHDPGKLVDGDTLDEQQAFVRAALDVVHRQLHTTREDLARLQLDARHAQHLRFLALEPPQREAERAAMVDQARAWDDEAARIEAVLLAAAAAAAQADANCLKGARK